MGRYRWITLLLAVTAGILLGAGDRPTSRRSQLPTTRPTSSPADAFRVATYNINWGNPDLPKVVETIREADADLICLQETNRRSERYLRRALGRDYRYRFFHRSSAAGGFAFLSKAPLHHVRYFPPEHGWFGTLVARTRLGGRDVQIANVHLHPVIPRRRDGLGGLVKLFLRTEKTRAKEIRKVYADLSTEIPTLVVGDLNSTPNLSAPHFLRGKGFADSFAAVTESPDRYVTWSWWYRGVKWQGRIDYIFHSAHFRTISSRILVSDASDHRLLVSTLSRAAPKRARTATRPGGKGE